MINTKFDVAVIGSSPLLMLCAIDSAKLGKSVILVEDKKQLGGAWYIDSHVFKGIEFQHETACHLIEWYKGVYNFLEISSGVKFKRLEPQPLKIFNNGKIEYYTSKKSILKAYMWLWVALLKNCIKIFISGTQKKAKIKDNVIDEISILVESIRIESKFRIKALADYDGVYGPVGGFVKFIEHLTSQLAKEKVKIISGKMTNIQINSEGEKQIIVDGQSITVKKIIVGESCNTNIPGIIPNLSTQYFHVLMATPASNVLQRNSYLHYPENPIFHRITYVDDVQTSEGIENVIFLIQLRKSYAEIENFHSEFDIIQNLFRIVKVASNVSIIKVIEDSYISTRKSSGWNVYNGNSPIVMKTIGDLSKNISQMKNQSGTEKCW